MFLGPGWFADVLEVTIKVDGPQTEEPGESYIIPWHPFKGTVTMCNITGVVTGKVVITAPAPHKVWHNGIKVLIEEYAHYVDPFVSTDYGKMEEMIAPAGYIQGTVEFPYAINLESSPCHWHESYDGKSFGLKQTITATALRPWYTFHCSAFLPLRFYKIVTPPPIPVLPPVPAKDLNSSVVQEGGGVENLALISIPDCGGKCELDIGSTWIDINGYINATLTLDELTGPITMAQVVLLRGEYVDTELTESIVLVHTVFGVGSQALAAEASREEIPVMQSRGYASRRDKNFEQARPDDPVVAGVTFQLEIPLNPPGKARKHQQPIWSSFELDPNKLLRDEDASTDAVAGGGLCSSRPAKKPSEKEALALRHYLRVIIQDTAENDYWNTVEVQLYRSTEPAVVTHRPLEVSEVTVSSVELEV